jgi:hypothetical protein
MMVKINGMACIVSDDATIGTIRSEHHNLLQADQVLEEDGHGGTRVLKDSDQVREGATLHSIPKIVKGASNASPKVIKGSANPRLEEEIDLLRKAAGLRSEIVVGTKTIGDCRYSAVLLKNVRLNPKKFNVTKTDLLFLLPTDYPRLPPIGVYLNYKWETADQHFLLHTAHGAPILRDEGWFWYCVGLGGGFEGRTSWRPGSQAHNGHNLVTLFVAARHAINTEEE